MATVKVERLCVACRKMIPPNDGDAVIIFMGGKLLYEAKTGLLKAKTDNRVHYCMCSECSKEFKGLVDGQIAKGYKVL